MAMPGSDPSSRVAKSTGFDASLKPVPHSRNERQRHGVRNVGSDNAAHR